MDGGQGVETVISGVIQSIITVAVLVLFYHRVNDYLNEKARLFVLIQYFFRYVPACAYIRLKHESQQSIYVFVRRIHEGKHGTIPA